MGTQQVSATQPDWSREVPRRWWDPSRRLIRAMRRYQSAKARGGLLGAVVSRYWVLQHRFWSVVCGADIPINLEFGGGLLLPHPNGIVIHPNVSIGPNCVIFQQVTLVGRVQIGGHVDLGAGAKVIRAVKIGDHAQVGANAVVLRDISEGAIVVGVPAVELRKD